MKTEDDVVPPGPLRTDLASGDEITPHSCPRCDRMDRLVLLYRENDAHAANTLRARRQIELDEADIARLIMAAGKYQEAAKKRANMVRLERQRENRNAQQVECNREEIEELHRKLGLK